MKYVTKQKIREAGQAMIMSTVFFVIISVTVILGLGAMVSGSQRLVSNSIGSEQAFYVAEAGAEMATYEVIHHVSISVAPNLDGHRPQVSVVDEGDNSRVTSRATLGGVTRTIEVLLSVSTSSADILSWKEVQ